MNIQEQIERMQKGLERVESGKLGTEEAMADLVAIYKEAAGAIKSLPFADIQKQAKAMVQDIIVETGKMNWQTEFGSAYIPAPGKPTVKYNAAALDALCESMPELKELLWPHREETSRPGSLTIR